MPKPSRLEPLLSGLLHLLPLLYIPLVLAIIPIDQVFSLDNDEGINLMKSLLVREGYGLYQEIWSDQPPLFTVLLVHWWQIWGVSVTSARMLVLLFAAGLLWCLGQIVRRSLGTVGAIATLLILINSRYFIKLSASVMIGLPAIALALLSLYWLWLPHRRHRGLTLWTSGIAFGLSLQTKLFTIFLLPLLGLSLLWPRPRISDSSTSPPQQFSLHPFPLHRQPLTQRLQRQPLLSLLLWLSSLGLTYLAVGLFCQSLQWDQLLQTHVVSRQGRAFQESSFFSITYLVKNTFGLDYLFWVLGGVGLVVALLVTLWKSGHWKSWKLQQPIQRLFPLLWLATAFLLLAHHRPVWYHHGLLLSIPLAWLGGEAVQRLFPETLQDNRRQTDRNRQSWSSWGYRGLVGLLLVGALVLETLHFWPERDRYPEQAREASSKFELVEQLQQYQAQTQWVLTDRPMYAFRAGLNVPPPLAVPSMKRFQRGDLGEEALLDILKIYQPEQILLPNPQRSQIHQTLASSEALQNQIRRDYIQLRYQDIEQKDSIPPLSDSETKPEAAHWIRRSLIPSIQAVPQKLP